MNMAQERNIGAYLAVKDGGASGEITAGGSGDATEVDGKTVDLLGLSAKFRSAVLVFGAVQASGDIANTKVCSVTANLQDSADGSTWTDFTPTGESAVNIVSAQTIITGDGGATIISGTYAKAVDLSAARRYVRCQFTPDLSATGTDTATVQLTWVLGGGDQGPTTLNA